MDGDHQLSSNGSESGSGSSLFTNEETETLEVVLEMVRQLDDKVDKLSTFMRERSNEVASKIDVLVNKTNTLLEQASEP